MNILSRDADIRMRIDKDRYFNSIQIGRTLKIPRYTGFSILGDTPGMEGNIIIDRNTGNFCWHDGVAWQCLSSTAGTVFPWELQLEGSLRNVRENTTTPFTQNGITISNDENLLFGSTTINSGEVGFSGTRVFFIGDATNAPNQLGSIRAGTTTSDQWDITNIGLASVAFGTDTIASSNYTTISGGSSSSILNSVGATIGGGISNSITGAEQSTIGGGYGNNININGYATISGGAGNINTGFFAVISGGFMNNCTPTTSTISGGLFNNILIGIDSSIGGGNANTIMDADYGTIGGGRQNLLNPQQLFFSSEYATISGGYKNVAGSPYSIIPGGASAVTQSYGQWAHANGELDGIPGSAQSSEYILRRSFFTGFLPSPPTISLTLDGAELLLPINTINIPTNVAWSFEICVVARETSIVNISAGNYSEKFCGSLNRDIGNAFIISPIVASCYSAGGANILPPGSASISIGPSGDYLDVEITTTIGNRWSVIAIVKTCELRTSI